VRDAEFKCKFCEYRGRNSSDTSKHMFWRHNYPRAPTEEERIARRQVYYKTVECKFCNKSLRRMNLKRHILVHHTDRAPSQRKSIKDPVNCPHCGLQISQRTLRKHIANKHSTLIDLRETSNEPQTGKVSSSKQKSNSKLVKKSYHSDESESGSEDDSDDDETAEERDDEESQASSHSDTFDSLDSLDSEFDSELESEEEEASEEEDEDEEVHEKRQRIQAALSSAAKK